MSDILQIPFQILQIIQSYPALTTGLFTLLGVIIGLWYQNHSHKPKLEVHTVLPKSAWHYTIMQGAITRHIFLAYISIVNKGWKDVSVASADLNIFETENRSDVKLFPQHEIITLGDRVIPLSILNSDKGMIKSGQLVNFLVGFESGLGDEPVSLMGELHVKDAFGNEAKPLRVEFQDIPYQIVDATLYSTILEDSLIPNRLDVEISWEYPNYTITEHGEYTFYVDGLTIANRGKHEIYICSTPRLMVKCEGGEWCSLPPSKIPVPTQLQVKTSRLADSSSILLKRGDFVQDTVSYTFEEDKRSRLLISGDRIEGRIIVYDGFNNTVEKNIVFRQYSHERNP